MYNFTDNPLETLMKQKPGFDRRPERKAPPRSPCRGCPFWEGMVCLGKCRRNLKLPAKEDNATSGQVGPKSL
jgi:hypothetical protein